MLCSETVKTSPSAALFRVVGVRVGRFLFGVVGNRAFGFKIIIDESHHLRRVLFPIDTHDSTGSFREIEYVRACYWYDTHF